VGWIPERLKPCERDSGNLDEVAGQLRKVPFANGFGHLLKQYVTPGSLTVSERRCARFLAGNQRGASGHAG